MDGKIFSFDLQRFDGEFAWSIGSGTADEPYQFANGTSSIASLSISGTTWSLSAGPGNESSPVVSINANDTISTIFSSVSSSINGSTIKTFDASSVELPFYFKFAAKTPITSITGGGGGASIDATNSSNKIYLGGGSGADLLRAGSGGASLNGGTSGADTLVGGNGIDYFIFGGESGHTASIQSYKSNDFISLTSGAALPVASSVGTVNSNDLALYFGTNGTASLTILDAKDSVVTVVKDNETYYYSKDFIATDNYKNVSLTSGATSLDATKGNFSSKAVSIDASGVTEHVVTITLNNKGNHVIGGSSGNSIYGGEGADKISLQSGEGKDLFYYKGGGADSIIGVGTGDSIKLTKGFNLVTDGNYLESISGQPGKFKLSFDDKNKNSLTFSLSGGDAVSVYANSGTYAETPYEYTATAISIAGGDGAGKGQVTLGKDYNLGDKFEDSGNAFSIISAAAVSVTGTAGSTFSIQGGSTASNIYGSDKVVTSIIGGEGQDTLRAGKAGAILNGGGSTNGGDLLIGNSGKDTFLYTGGANSIQSYTYSTVEATADVVSISGADLTIPTTFDTTQSAHASYKGSDYVVSLGSSNSLTFKTKQQFALKTSDSIYTYTPNSIALEYETNKGITIGGDYYTSKTFNGASDANSGFASIDASEVNHAIKVTGNGEANYMVASSLYGGTLLGGANNDTLQAGSVGAYMDGGDGDVLYIGSGDKTASIGADTFVYRGNAASIKNYNAGDVVSFSARDITITDATISAESVTGENDSTVYNISLNFGGTNDKIIFQSLDSGIAGDSDTGVSLQSGRSNLYVYKKDSVTWNDKSITLTADYATASYTADNASLVTIDAHLVGQSIGTDTFSIAGNDNANYIIGSANNGNSISGGKGNDTLVGNTVTTAADVFQYTEGNDVIIGFGSADSFEINGGSYNPNSITKAKANKNGLTFTINKSNTIAFRASDNVDVPEIVSLSGGGYLTANGVVSSIATSNDGEYSLKLFPSAKGTIDLNDSLYSAGKITSVNAAAASNGLTITAKKVADSVVSYDFATNKKRDTFEYAGGTVSITGFESGKDRLDISDYSIGTFSIHGSGNDTKGDVLISLNGGADVVSLGAAQGNEILIRANGARGYSKMVFSDSGVLENRAKNPTSATVSANATAYEAGSVRKITVRTTDNAVSIYAGAKGSAVDASNAGASVSLIGGAKADKFTGSNHADVFFFDTSNGGKDVFNGFVDGTVAGTSDSIAFGRDGNGSASLLSDAKISASKKAIKFKFGKNTLTLKDDSIKDAKLQIAGTTYSYGKNAIINENAASLTSAFGGSYKVSDGITTVNGALVNKNLTFKGSGADETLTGGKKKTTFKGGGGADSLVGGSGNDVFFYAKGDTGTANIADFDVDNDKLKIAGGTLRKIETVDGGGITFDMSQKNNKDDPAVGHFKIESFYENGTPVTLDADKAKKTLIHTNNTYYWFATATITEAVTTEGGDGSPVTLAKEGDLITWSDKKVSKSDIGDRDVIELNYGTNLVKSGVATLVSSKDNGASNLPT